MFWVGLLVLALTLGYFYLKNANKYWLKKGIRQAEPMLFFGNSFGTMTGREAMAECMVKCYENASKSRYLGMYIFTNPMLQISCPDLLKQITVKDFEHFTDHQSFVPEDEPMFGKFLTLLKGKKWRDVRSVMSPTFTSSKIRYLFGHMQEAANQFIDYFKMIEGPIEIEMKDTFTRFTSDVIATTVFGARVDSLKHRDNEFYRMVSQATDLSSLKKTSKIMVYLLLPWLFKALKLTVLGAKINNYFEKMIKSTIKEREENAVQRPDLMSLLVEAKKGTLKIEEEKCEADTGFAIVQEHIAAKKQQRNEITDDDIVGQAMIFFFAGFETVASLMCFVAYELAANPDIQTRLRDEINETFSENNGEITYDAIIEMKYLDMVVSETLRKWPVNSSTDRCCTKPYTIEPTRPDEKPVHLKVGDLIWIPIFGLHRDPAYYPDPERFDPERFNKENRKNINPYTYLPFGLGPRNCIATRFALLETKLIIVNILRNFDIRISPKMKVPLQLNKKGPLLSAEGGTWLYLHRLD